MKDYRAKVNLIKEFSMNNKKLWLVSNLILISIASTFDKLVFLLISIFSYAFLYENFIISIKDYFHRKITFKVLFKEYVKYQALTPITMKIFVKMIIGTDMIINTLLKFKYVSITDNSSDFLHLCGGILLIRSMFKNMSELCEEKSDEICNE